MNRAYSRASFERLMTTAHGLVAKQYQLYNQSIIPAFDKHAIRLVSHGERSVAQRKWVREYFMREVQPLLMPVGLDPSHPFRRSPTRPEFHRAPQWRGCLREGQ
jgi:polyphosphate kinase